MTQEYSDYIERNQPLVEFFVKTDQCGGLSIPLLRRWLSNFPDDKGKYFAVRMLKHFLFYSDNDVLRLLQFGFEYFVKEKKARQRMLKSNFVMMPSILNPLLQEELNDTIFIPLLSDNKPTESGEEIIRLLSKKLQISDSCCMFHWDLTDEVVDRVSRIVIVDDNIGSGDQLETFWKYPLDLYCNDFDQMLNKFSLEIVYLSLVAVSGTIDRLRVQFPKLSVIASEEVDESYSVFSDRSYFWRTLEEKEEAKDYIQTLAEERGVPFLGHKSMDYAVMIGKYIPDWVLPIFWKSAADWQPLI